MLYPDSLVTLSLSSHPENGPRFLATMVWHWMLSKGRGSWSAPIVRQGSTRKYPRPHLFPLKEKNYVDEHYLELYADNLHLVGIRKWGHGNFEISRPSPIPPPPPHPHTNRGLFLFKLCINWEPIMSNFFYLLNRNNCHITLLYLDFKSTIKRFHNSENIICWERLSLKGGGPWRRLVELHRQSDSLTEMI